MANIFASESDESPITVIKQTMGVSMDDDGTPIVSFATNRGKGSGAQSMPISEFREYVETLSEIAENGIPDVEEEVLSAAESLRRTVANKDGIVSFRVRSGKGAKPAKVPVGQLTEVANLLTSTIDAVEAAGQKMLTESE
jgi:hypothetical protein